MTSIPTEAPFIGWDWHVVHDADMHELLPPLFYSGSPIDLTGCTVQLYVRPTYAYEDPIVEIATGSGITVDDAANGLLTVHVPKTTVDNWPLGEWRFWMTVTDGGGKITEVARGPFAIHPGNVL